MTDLIIYGASGHGKVVYDAVLKLGIKTVNFYDDDISKVMMFDQEILHELPEEGKVIIAVGNNNTRKEIVAKHQLNYCEALKHPSCVIGINVEVGKGSVAFAGSVINPDVKVGSHVIINTNATVEHDCVIHDFAHISPNATLCGTVEIGEGTQVGAGAVILPNLKIGKWCTIAAGSVVTKNVPNFSKVIGVPGKITGLSDA